MTKPPDNEEFPTLSKPGGKGPDREDSSPFDNPSEISKGDRIDDFEILERIGEGGMGVVYKAYETSLKRIVALKVLHPNIISDVSIAKRFRREAVLAANLSHPHIVPVFHIENSETPRYFTMEFVQGISLEEKVEKEGFLSENQAVRIVIQACEALQYAHEHNIIHRDIKPSNIMLQNHVERVRVTDFGIAQDVTGKLADVTQTGMSTAGTPGFESPEQNLGQKLDERTDIFSLGMMLYYMLTGRLVYKGENRAQLAVAFREQVPSPPSRFNTEVGSTIDKIVLKMISVNPEKRYQTALAVAADLRKIAIRDTQKRTQKNRVLNILRVIRKPINKYRTPLLIGLSSLVLLVICISIFIFFRWRNDKTNAVAQVVYRADFSSDPEWTTNSPSKMYWDQQKGKYHFEITGLGEYAFVPIEYSAALNYKLEFDIEIVDLEYNSGISFGLYDSNMRDQKPVNWQAHYGRGDGGNGASFRYNGDSSSGYFPPGYEFLYKVNTDYHNEIVYDATAQKLTWQVTRISDGVVVADYRSPDGIGTFTGVDRICATRVPQGAKTEGYIDNVVLSVSEPGALTGRITFISPYLYSEGGKLWVMDASTGLSSKVEVPLDPTLLSVGYPEWSWDGSWITFHAVKKGEETKTGLYVVEPNGSNFCKVSPDNMDIGHPSFSPDGSQIVGGSSSYRLYICTKVGECNWQTEYLTDGVHPQWSPKGNKIAYSNWGLKREYESDFFLYDLNTNTSTQITNHGPGGAFYFAAWSPDGTKLAIVDVNHHTDKNDIWVMNADGSEPRALTADWPISNELYPSWSSDGKYIVFNSDKSGNWDIWYTPADHFAPMNITNSPENETQPAIGATEPAFAFSDDFEDGVIDTSLWVTHGRKGGYGGLGAGNWQYSFNEIEDGDGYLEARVWGPISGMTYFGEASVRTTYNFNDGQPWLINFTWETTVGFSPAFDCFGIQITDGGFPKSDNSYWVWNGNPPGTVTLWYVKTGFYPEESEAQFSKRTWSITISPEGIASFYKSPDVLDKPYSQVTLDPSRQWYIRFVQVDATASGLPPGDNTFKLYVFSAVCEPANLQPAAI